MWVVYHILILTAAISPFEVEEWIFKSPSACYLAGKVAEGEQGIAAECRPTWIFITTSKQQD